MSMRMMYHSNTAPLTSSLEEGPDTREALQIQNYMSLMAEGVSPISICLPGVHALLLLLLLDLKILHVAPWSQT